MDHPVLLNSVAIQARESCPCPSNPSDLGTRKPREHVHGETHEEVHREGQEERVQRAEDVAQEGLDEMVLKEHNAMTIARFEEGQIITADFLNILVAYCHLAV